MKKLKFILNFTILIVTVIMLIFTIYKKTTYSLSKVISMLDSINLPENIYISNETLSNNQTMHTDYYVKNNLIYIYQKNSSSLVIESLYDLEKLKCTTILHPYKSIVTTTIDSNFNCVSGPIRDSFLHVLNLYENNIIFKYCGKEIVNENNCIKISLTHTEDNIIDVYYYYIDLESNYIVKFENYSGDNENNMHLISSETYKYCLDSVTDEDISNFDINNYPDYDLSEVK